MRGIRKVSNTKLSPIYLCLQVCRHCAHQQMLYQTAAVEKPVQLWSHGLAKQAALTSDLLLHGHIDTSALFPPTVPSTRRPWRGRTRAASTWRLCSSTASWTSATRSMSQVRAQGLGLGCLVCAWAVTTFFARVYLNHLLCNAIDKPGANDPIRGLLALGLGGKSSKAAKGGTGRGQTCTRGSHACRPSALKTSKPRKAHPP